VRDSFLAAFVVLAFDGGGASMAGAAAVTLVAAALLPRLLLASAGLPRARTGAAWAVPATALLFAGIFAFLPRLPGEGAEEPSALARRKVRPGRPDVGPGGRAWVAAPARRVSIGDIGRLQKDLRPILEVDVLRGGAPAHAEDLGPLFRGGALESFDGVEWTAEDRMARPLRDADDGRGDGWVTLPRRRLPAGETVEQRLRFLVGGSDSLFCLGMPVAVGGEGARRGVKAVARGEARAAEPYGEGATFAIRSLAVAGEYPAVDAEPFLGAERLDVLLDVPPGHEQAAALARREVRHAGGGRRLLRRLEVVLRERCSYSLDIEPPRRASAVETFLFESRRGHCELFASAACVILRSLGVPARLAIGFRGGRFDAAADRYTLRGADAHAWVEAWFPGEGWVSFDPTPAPGEPPPAEWEDEGQGAAGGGPGFWDRLLGYDGGAQRRLLARASDGVASAVRNTFLAPGGSPRWTSLLLLALAAALLAGAARLRALAAPRAPPEGPAAPPAPPPAPPAAWAALLERLAREGILPLPSETSRELAGRAGAAGFRPAEALLALAAASDAERWGGRVPSGRERDSLLALARALSPPAPATPAPPEGDRGRGR
jgi:hypothetical protein